MAQGHKGTKSGQGSGFSYDCPLCKKRHREDSKKWYDHLSIYEEYLKNLEKELRKK